MSNLAGLYSHKLKVSNIHEGILLKIKSTKEPESLLKVNDIVEVIGKCRCDVKIQCLNCKTNKKIIKFIHKSTFIGGRTVTNSAHSTCHYQVKDLAERDIDYE
jgi:hypothetical protein